jgi:acyl-CoA thioester hydrolase
MSEFSIELPVRWGDMDSFGHVSNVVYLRYLEECRARWMDSVPSHWQDGDAGPVVANININFRQPMYWPGDVEVTLAPASPGRSSIKLEHEIRSLSEENEPTVFADATCTLVWIDKNRGEPVPLPGCIRDLGQ